MTDRARATREELEAAIKEMRAYHRQGRASLRKHPAQGGNTRNAVDEQAEQLSWNPTRLRKARQFADRDTGYTRERLAELCDLLRQHHPVFGTSHVGILVTLSWAEGRAGLQRLCVVNNWSKAELELEVQRRVGPRRHGGRKRRVGADPVLALVQLERMAETWRRWCAAAADADADEDADAHGVLADLPRAVRNRVRTVSTAMLDLRGAVVRKLAAARADLQRP